MKVGRNGKSETIPDEVRLQFERLKAKQMLVEKQQGLGRSIISIEFKGYRMIAVGNRMWYSKKWKTFHDFLFEYIRQVFGKDWGQVEFSKPFEDRHPLIQWYELAHRYLQQHQSGEGIINDAPMSGAVSAIMNLSYNLYLLAHNAEVQDRLIRRLKDKNNFRGAQYETYVAAEFIKAGFKLEIENEEDSRTTHCEFTAISNKTGKKFSIEAKARQPHKDNVSISKQIADALNKQAKHERVIFIDINIPDFLKKMPDIIVGIKQKEMSWKEDQKAYIFVTNHPFEYDLEGIAEHRAGFGHGFKIPEFSLDFQFTSLRDALNAREEHIDMFDLIRSVCEHEEIPVTFDGEHPEFAFADKDAPPRLIIGQKYLIPNQDGQNVEAVLEIATVSEHEKKTWGVYRTITGERVHCTNPMTDEELIAYRRQPDTFFGVPIRQTRKAKDPIDLFDFFYGSYKNTPRERILELMKDRVDIEALKNLNDKELKVSYCEGLVYEL